MTERLFVYGTLGRGRPNERVLADIGGDWETAWVSGRLLEEGWGAGMGFPGIALDGLERVDGFLFTSAQIHRHWEELDAFEGAAYRRVLTTVNRHGKPALEAWIYALSRASG